MVLKFYFSTSVDIFFSEWNLNPVWNNRGILLSTLVVNLFFCQNFSKKILWSCDFAFTKISVFGIFGHRCDFFCVFVFRSLTPQKDFKIDSLRIWGCRYFEFELSSCVWIYPVIIFVCQVCGVTLNIVVLIQCVSVCCRVVVFRIWMCESEF